MTIEQIGENRLKITLSGDELNKNDITPEDLSPSSGKLKRFLISLVRMAAIETGFEAAGSNIMVESRPEGDGLIFFITRLSPGMHRPPQPSRSVKSPVLKAYRVPVKKNATAIFAFSDEKGFAEFFAAVRGEDFSVSSLYIMEGKYYFKTTPDSRLFNHAMEFASPVYSQLLAIRLAKYGRLICRGESFFKLL